MRRADSGGEVTAEMRDSVKVSVVLIAAAACVVVVGSRVVSVAAGDEPAEVPVAEPGPRPPQPAARSTPSEDRASGQTARVRTGDPDGSQSGTSISLLAETLEIPHLGPLDPAQQAELLSRIRREKQNTLAQLQTAGEPESAGQVAALASYRSQVSEYLALLKYEAAHAEVGSGRYFVVDSTLHFLPSKDRSSAFEYIAFQTAARRGAGHVDVIVPIPLHAYPEIREASELWAETQRELDRARVTDLIDTFNAKPVDERRRRYEQHRTALRELQRLSAELDAGRMGAREFARATRALTRDTLPGTVRVDPDSLLMRRLTGGSR